MSVRTITDTQLLKVLNTYLNNQPDFIEGMSFDEIKIVNGLYQVRTHHFLDDKGRATENTLKAGVIYDRILNEVNTT